MQASSESAAPAATAPQADYSRFSQVDTLTAGMLAGLVSDSIGLHRAMSTRLVAAFFEEISQALVRGESVKLAGFGRFTLRDKASRPGRNPKTGEAAIITARRVVKFRASPTFKDRSLSSPSDIRSPAARVRKIGIPRVELQWPVTIDFTAAAYDIGSLQMEHPAPAAIDLTGEAYDVDLVLTPPPAAGR